MGARSVGVDRRGNPGRVQRTEEALVALADPGLELVELLVGRIERSRFAVPERDVQVGPVEGCDVIDRVRVGERRTAGAVVAPDGGSVRIRHVLPVGGHVEDAAVRRGCLEETRVPFRVDDRAVAAQRKPGHGSARPGLPVALEQLRQLVEVEGLPLGPAGRAAPLPIGVPAVDGR